ncbi:unnamed protein product [Closterium sp. NIES-65]|nr:unnamed protein product [Closterium sp. NIES-65]
MSTKLQVSKAVTKKNTATGGPVQSPGKVQNGTKKKCTEAAPKPRSSSGDGPPGGEVRKSSRPRKAKVWFEEGADATEEGADPVKSAGNNLDGDDVDNQKHEDEAEANDKSGDVGENEVDEAVDDAGGEPEEEEEDLAEDDAEEKAEEEEGDEAEEEEGDEAEEEEGDEAEEEEGDEAEEEEGDEAEEEEDDEAEEEEDEESEEGQGDEDEAEKGSEKGDSAEVEEGADAHKPQITRKASFDEMLEEQGDGDDEDMEDEAVAEERSMLLGKLKALDEIKEPVVSSKLARKGVKPLPRSEPSKVPAKPPRGKDAVTSAKGKEKVLATESILGGKSKREFALVVGGAQKKQNTGEVSAKPKSTPTAAGAGTSGGKAKAGAGASGVKAKAGAGASGVKAKAGAGTSGVKAKAGAGTSGHCGMVHLFICGMLADVTSLSSLPCRRFPPIHAVTVIPSLPSPSLHPCRPLHPIPAVTFIPSLPSPSSHPCRHLHPIPAVTFIPSLPSPSSHPCRPLHPIPAVTFIPSLPSPSSHPCRPLHPIPAVPFIPSLPSPLTRPSVTFPPSLPSRIQSAATNQYSGAAPPVKVITEATKRYELVPVKKTPFVAASCDRRQEHGGVSNVELDQFERRVMARFAEMLSAILRGAGPSVPIGAPAATPPHSGPSTSSFREVMLYLNPNSPLLACPLSPQPQTPLASPSRHREVRLYLNPNSPLACLPTLPSTRNPTCYPKYRPREVRLYLNPNSPLPDCPLSPQPETPLASHPGLGSHLQTLTACLPYLPPPLSPFNLQELSRRVATHLCFNIEASMIQFYPSAEEALDHGFSEFVSPQVLASLRVLFQHNDASTRGVFFKQLSSTRTSINGWMRKVALTALGRQANRCYLGRLPADLLAPLEFYTDEELIARYKDGERGLAWHRELLIPFGRLIFSVSIKLALARRGVNTEKIKTRQLGWILYAFEWPILNNAPDGKLSGKWEYNRIHIAEFLPSHPSPSSHLIRPLLPISSVPFFPSHPSPSSHLIRPLPPISSVPFFPSHPSPSSHLIRPLPPISSVPFLPSPSVPYASLHRLHDLHQPGLGVAVAVTTSSRSMGTCGAAVAATGQVRSSRGSMGTGAEQQGQQGDRCGAAVAAWGQVRSSSGSMGTGAEQQWQHGDRCGAAGAAWGQVRSSSGSMGTGAEQQGQHGDRCEASGAAGGQVRSSSGSRGTGAEQQWQHGDRCGAAVAAWGQVRSSRGSMGTGAEQQGQQGDRCGAAGAAGGQVRSSRGSRRTGAEQQGQEGDRCGGA